jgi:heat shock protein HslJ
MGQDRPMRRDIMRSRVTHTAIAMMLGMLATGGTLACAQGAAVSWLDEPELAAWNTPGQTIPAAPPRQELVNPRCRALARPAQIEEDNKVRDRGWDLVGAFQGGWQVLVVRGTASYDGMCRPLQYLDFVFVRGIFAGTLAPTPMDSRTDGALARVSLQGPTQLTAEYLRYETSDALCCASRTTSVTFQIAPDRPLIRAVSASTSPNAAAPGAGCLAGTSWQLIRFEGSNDAVLTPDERAKYTIAFGADGRVSARIDCNRGSGTWKSSGSSDIEFGPLALTRAACPTGSLHDQIVMQWGNIRSYVIRGGHLFLALMADGGIYEFEPVTRSN